MTFVSALIAGLLFGAGLLISGMTDPQRVLGFLDVAGRWDPSLAFTMAGAIVAANPAFTLVRRRGANLWNRPVTPIDRTRIDRPLVLGSVLFGVGWGLSGICPGPGLILLTSRNLGAFVFVAGVGAGALVAGVLRRRGTVALDVDPAA